MTIAIVPETARKTKRAKRLTPHLRRVLTALVAEIETAEFITFDFRAAGFYKTEFTSLIAYASRELGISRADILAQLRLT